MLGIPPVPVPLVVGLLLLGTVLGVFVALRILQRPLWAVPAAVVGLLAVGILLAEPVVPPLPTGTVPPDVGGGADFKTRYDQYRTLYGKLLECGFWEGFAVCWTAYARIEFQRDQVAYNRFLHGNLGYELLRRRKLETDTNPIVPPIVLSYQAAEAGRGLDWLYWVGYPITNPRANGDRIEQYFDKALLSWPTGSSDPSEVRRESVGEQLWRLVYQRVDIGQHGPWTELRLQLLAAAIGALLIGALPLLRPRWFGSPVPDFDV